MIDEKVCVLLSGLSYRSPEPVLDYHVWIVSKSKETSGKASKISSSGYVFHFTTGCRGCLAIQHSVFVFPRYTVFAFVSLAVDRHRLRVFDVNTSQVVFEHSLDRTRITSLAWLSYILEDPDVPEEEFSPSKKRKKLTALSGETNKNFQGQTGVKTLALGFSDGSVQVLSVVQGRIIKTLSHATSTSSILALVEGGSYEDSDKSLWTSSSDGTLRLWDLLSSEILISVQNDARTPYTALAIRPSTDEGQLHILAADNTIHLLSSSADSTSSDDSILDTLVEICTFGGHASAVKSLRWDSSTNKRFYSFAEDDRFVYVWDVPEPPSSRGNLAASCPLDSDVRQIDLCFMSGKQVLLTLSSSGKITLSPIPAEMHATTVSKNSVKQQIPTLLPRSTVSLSKKAPSSIHVAAATFVRDDPSKILTALVSGGARVAFETVVSQVDLVLNEMF